MTRARIAGFMPMLMLTLVAGCSRDVDAQRAAAAASSKALVPAVSAPAVSPAAPVADVELEQVRAALGEWQAAQEKLDFERYAALYAEAFRGVKQVGERRFRFDRKGWLADRRPMFKPGLALKVTKLELVRVEREIAAFFTQEFASPSFRDRGRKVLVFSRAAGGVTKGFRITREEMLSSEVLGGGGSVAMLPGFFFARPDAVVLRSTVEERWLTPARLEVARAFRRAVENPETDVWPDETFLELADLRLPTEVTAFQGKKLYVTRAPVKGATALPPPCEVTVKRVDVTNTGTAAFESTRGARGMDHIYGSVLLGYFDRPCEGALWASETPPGAQFVPEQVPLAVLDGALRELRATPEAKQRGLGPDATVAAALFGDPAKPRLLFVELSRDPWSESFASVSALFEHTAEGKRPRLLGVIFTDTSLKPVLAFDANADGSLEILAQESHEDDPWYVLDVRAGRVAKARVYFSPNFVCSG